MADSDQERDGIEHISDDDDDDDDAASSSSSDDDYDKEVVVVRTGASSASASSSTAVPVHSFFHPRKAGEGSVLADELMEDAIRDISLNPPDKYSTVSWPASKKKGKHVKQYGVLLYHETFGFTYLCCATRKCQASKVRAGKALDCNISSSSLST